MDIFSFALGYKKVKSTGGGGGTSGDERVKYVTFMRGEEELLKYPVISGDTCHDPVADGMIDTPTKEQTVSTVYTFSGWALTDGGAASSSALANVTEDRTVYVAFTEAARKYTINFYDGETLLKSEQWAYGETPSYGENPQKTGYTFTAWNPDLVAVTGDADYYAQWVEKVTFVGSTWADIVRVAENGLAAETFAIGDTRQTTFYSAWDGSEIPVELKIVGINADALRKGGGTAGLSIIINKAIDGRHFTTNGAIYGSVYGSSAAARAYAGQLRTNKCLDEEILTSIKLVSKLATDPASSYTAPTVAEYGAYAWGLSATEIFGSSSYSPSGQGNQYPYFKNADNRKINGQSGAATSWATASLTNVKNEACVVVDGNGKETTGNTQIVVVGFCI